MASPKHQAKKQRLLDKIEAEQEAALAGASAPEPENQCEVCGFVAKTAGGLTSHQRSHKDG